MFGILHGLIGIVIVKAPDDECAVGKTLNHLYFLRNLLRVQVRKRTLAP